MNVIDQQIAQIKEDNPNKDIIAVKRSVIENYLKNFFNTESVTSSTLANLNGFKFYKVEFKDGAYLKIHDGDIEQKLKRQHLAVYAVYVTDGKLTLDIQDLRN